MKKINSAKDYCPHYREELRKEIIRCGYSLDLEESIYKAILESEMPLEVSVEMMKHPEIAWEFKGGEIWFQLKHVC